MSDSDIKILEVKCAEARYRESHPLKAGLRQIRVHEHKYISPMYSISAFGGPHNIRYGNQAHWISEFKIATQVVGINRISLLLHLDCAYGRFLMQSFGMAYSLETEIDFCKDTSIYVTEFIGNYIPGTNFDIYMQKHDNAEEIFVFNGTDFVLFNPSLVSSRS